MIIATSQKETTCYEPTCFPVFAFLAISENKCFKVKALLCLQDVVILTFSTIAQEVVALILSNFLHVFRCRLPSEAAQTDFTITTVWPFFFTINM